MKVFVLSIIVVCGCIVIYSLYGALKRKLRAVTSEGTSQGRLEPMFDDSKQIYVGFSIKDSIEDCFPMIRAPKEGCLIKHPIKGRSSTKGMTEEPFWDIIVKHRLNDHFYNQLTLVVKPNLYYEPDLAYVDEERGIFLDIEIDEPYVSLTHEPIHYKLHKGETSDFIRNAWFTERGWTVVRFSERQIHEYPLSCLKWIFVLLNEIDENISIPDVLSTKPNILPEDWWTKEDAEQMAKDLVREKYLGITEPKGPQTPKSIEVTNFEGSTHVEEQMVKHKKELGETHPSKWPYTDEDLLKGVKDEYGVIYSTDGKKLLKCMNGTLANYSIKEGTEVIGKWAFYGCQELKQINIPNGVVEICHNAFGWCTGLKELTMPNSMAIIKEDAFAQCSSLTKITIPRNVASIGKNAFQRCIELSLVNFNAIACEHSGGYPCWSSEVFNGCDKLSKVILGKYVTIMPPTLLKSCKGLVNIIIPESVHTIGSEVFGYCHNLSEIIIPNGVTEIGNHVFFRCSNLVSVSLGDSITSVGSYIFQKCQNLENVYSLNPIPPKVSITLGIEQSCECTLHVPKGAKEVYASAKGWNEFQHIVEI